MRDVQGLVHVRRQRLCARLLLRRITHPLPLTLFPRTQQQRPSLRFALRLAQDLGYLACTAGQVFFGFSSMGNETDEGNQVVCPPSGKLFASAKCNRRHPLHRDCCHSSEENNDDGCVAEATNASMAHVWMAALCSGCEHEATGANGGCDMSDDDWVSSDEVLAQPENFRPNCLDQSPATCTHKPVDSPYSHQCATSDGCAVANFSVYAGRPRPRAAPAS